MTELLRNFCTRQSLPWIASESQSGRNITGVNTLTSIRDLSDFVAFETVPALVITRLDKLHINMVSNT